MADYDYKVGDNSYVGWATTFEPSVAAPMIASRIYRTKADAEAYTANTGGSACQGLILSVVKDGINNGIYQIRFADGMDESSPRNGRYKLVRVDAEAAEKYFAGPGIVLTGDNQISVVLDNTKGRTADGTEAPTVDTDSKSGLKVNENGRVSVALVKDDTTNEYSGLETTGKGLRVKSGAGIYIDDRAGSGAVNVKSDNKRSTTVNAAAGVGVNVDNATIEHVGYKENGQTITPSALQVKTATDKTDEASHTNSGKNIINKLVDGSNKGLYANLWVKEEVASDNSGSTYKLMTGLGSEAAQLGDSIKVQNDSAVKSVELVYTAPYTADTIKSIETTTNTAPTSTSHSGFTWKDGQYMRFQYFLSNKKYNWVYVSISEFLNEAEHRDGLHVNANGTVQTKLGTGLHFGAEDAQDDNRKPIEVKLHKTGNVEDSGMSADSNGIKVNVDKGILMTDNTIGVNLYNERKNSGSGAVDMNMSGLEIKPTVDETGQGLGGKTSVGVKTDNSVVTAETSFGRPGRPSYAAATNSIDIQEKGLSTNAEILPVAKSSSAGFTVNTNCGGFNTGDVITNTDSVYAILKKLLYKVYDAKIVRNASLNTTITGVQDEIVPFFEDYMTNTSVKFNFTEGKAERDTTWGNDNPDWQGTTGTTPAFRGLVPDKPNSNESSLVEGQDYYILTDRDTAWYRMIQDRKRIFKVNATTSTATCERSDGTTYTKTWNTPEKTIEFNVKPSYKYFYGTLPYDAVGYETGQTTTDYIAQFKSAAIGLERENSVIGTMTTSKDSSARTFFVCVPKGMVVKSTNEYNNDTSNDWIKQENPIYQCMELIGNNDNKYVFYDVYCRFFSESGSEATIYKNVRIEFKTSTDAITEEFVKSCISRDFDDDMNPWNIGITTGRKFPIPHFRTWCPGQYTFKSTWSQPEIESEYTLKGIDDLYVVTYDNSSKDITMASAKVSAGTLTWSFPPEWIGRSVYVYYFAVCADGNRSNTSFFNMVAVE